VTYDIPPIPGFSESSSFSRARLHNPYHGSIIIAQYCTVGPTAQRFPYQHPNIIFRAFSFPSPAHFSDVSRWVHQAAPSMCCSLIAIVDDGNFSSQVVHIFSPSLSSCWRRSHAFTRPNPVFFPSALLCPSTSVDHSHYPHKTA